MHGGGTKSSSFQIPSELLTKKCILNINNIKENDCFKWAIIVSLHHKTIGNNKNRLEQYKQIDNFDNVKFPATVEDIVKFQKENKTVAINALLYHSMKQSGEDKTTSATSFSLVPLYHPSHSTVQERQIAHIILINNHWLPISNLNRLLADPTKATKHNKGTAFCY